MAHKAGPGEIPGVRPLLGHGKEYSDAIRTEIVDPFYRDMTADFLRTQLAYDRLQQRLNAVTDRAINAKTADKVARANLWKVVVSHKLRFERTMNFRLGVNVAPLLNQQPVINWFQGVVDTNVSWIKTIPSQFHASLSKELEKLLQTDAFNQRAVKSMLQTSYKSTGFNVYRLARDQTSKAVGKLTEMRQLQVGITEYVWSTSHDERVRQSHKSNDATTFKWDYAPATGHPGEDIMCRCIAMGVIPMGMKGSTR